MSTRALTLKFEASNKVLTQDEAVLGRVTYRETGKISLVHFWIMAFL
jgi:hypothetical protein